MDLDIIQKIIEAGVVGCGGAGFPTHAKYANPVDVFIINGAECEPLLRTDRHLMLHHAIPILEAAEAICSHLQAKRVILALKKTYYSEIENLKAAIAEVNSKVELMLMDNYYPAGDEQMVVYESTGRIVPPAGIPLDVGAVVSNVATVLHVRDAMENKAFTHRYLTVTGKVSKRLIARAPIGTPVTDCIQLAGGQLSAADVLINGGPMMGMVLDESTARNTFITKTTSGLILLDADSYLALKDQINTQHLINRVRASCIQCTFCTEMCPRYLTGHPLQPHKIMRSLAYHGGFTGILENHAAKQALICCQCGICTQFACPMNLDPCRVNALLKKEYAISGTRYEKTMNNYEARDEREYRRIPSKHIAARVGVSEFYDLRIDEFAEVEPDYVTIPLLQHIGVPSVPCVACGSHVRCGQVIAECPGDKMGAHIHASIDGLIREVQKKYITIERC